MALFLSPQHRALILHEAETHYPSECCGIGLASKIQPDTISKIIPLKNVQDLYHQKDSQTYPRTSRNAYLMDPQELLSVHKQAREEGQIIRLIYHSHIEAPALFSQEDKSHAILDGEDDPTYPEASYLIVSIQKQKEASMLLYHWDPTRRDFTLQV